MQFDLPLPSGGAIILCSGADRLRHHVDRSHGAAALPRGQPMTARITCDRSWPVVAALRCAHGGCSARMRRGAARADGHAGDVLADRGARRAERRSACENVPADGRQLALLKDYIARRMDTLAPTFAKRHGRRDADERVARRSAVPLRARSQHQDRRHRGRRAVVARRARRRAGRRARPRTSRGAAIRMPPRPPSRRTSGSASRTSIRMGDLIARDLAALFPDSAAAIAANLETLKRSLLELRGDYQDRLIESGRRRRVRADRRLRLS